MEYRLVYGLFPGGYWYTFYPCRFGKISGGVTGCLAENDGPDWLFCEKNVPMVYIKNGSVTADGVCTRILIFLAAKIIYRLIYQTFY